MAKFYLIGISLIFSLGTVCIWNCLRRDLSTDFRWHGCRDQDGQQTDSFFLYKLPRNKSSPYRLVQQGLGYMYLPSKRLSSDMQARLLRYTSAAWGWVMSSRSIADPLSMPGYTLGKLYTEIDFMKENALFIIYNDEYPNGTTSESHGHTKGVVVMTEQGGFWLIHSTPRYPPGTATEAGGSHRGGGAEGSGVYSTEGSGVYSTEGSGSYSTEGSAAYDYPVTGRRFGQTFMCISIPATEADNVGQQLLLNGPAIYSANVPHSLEGRYPVLERVVRRHRPVPPPCTPDGPQHRVTEVASQAGNTFTSFAKCRLYHKDLYSGLVAPTLKTGLFVESWRNGPKPMPSSCNNTQYRVENIESLSVRASDSTFTTHHDHSKWAVSNDLSKPYLCVGDINRMESQTHRGGGTTCVMSSGIWTSFRSMVDTVETCPK